MFQVERLHEKRNQPKHIFISVVSFSLAFTSFVPQISVRRMSLLLVFIRGKMSKNETNRIISFSSLFPSCFSLSPNHSKESKPIISLFSFSVLYFFRSSNLSKKLVRLVQVSSTGASWTCSGLSIIHLTFTVIATHIPQLMMNSSFKGDTGHRLIW